MSTLKESESLTVTVVLESVEENQVIHRAEGPPLIAVRADVLAPFLVYARKFFQKIESSNRSAISRSVDPEEFELSVRLKGFTPEDFNSLMSLTTSLTAELGPVLDQYKTPQMARPEVEKMKRLKAEATVKALKGKDNGSEEEK